jgi:transposase InsO family protein
MDCRSALLRYVARFTGKGRLLLLGAYRDVELDRNGPWRSLEEVEFATLEWVDWFNHRRLLEPIGDIPPAEFEAMYYAEREGPARVAAPN